MGPVFTIYPGCSDIGIFKVFYPTEPISFDKSVFQTLLTINIIHKKATDKTIHKYTHSVID